MGIFVENLFGFKMGGNYLKESCAGVSSKTLRYSKIVKSQFAALFLRCCCEENSIGTLILSLLLLGILLFFIYPVPAETSYIPYPAEPNQEFPTLEVGSPKNGEAFTSTNVVLNFTVTKPDSWNVYWLTTMPVIGSYIVHVYLDGKLHSIHEDPRSVGFPTANYSVFLNRLARGGHSVKIDVVAATFYDDPSPEPGDYLEYFRNVSETIHFTVNADLPTPSPEPTPTQEEAFPTTVVLAASVMVAVISLGLLVYFRKRKR